MKMTANQIAKEVLSNNTLIARVAKETKTCLFNRNQHVAIYVGEHGGIVVTSKQNGWDTRTPEINLHEKMTKKQVIEYMEEYITTPDNSFLFE